jgi:hypothetical protein
MKQKKMGWKQEECIRTFLMKGPEKFVTEQRGSNAE